MSDLIHECIDNFGDAPRKLSFWNRLTYLYLPKPDWLERDPADLLNTIFKNARKVFSEGVVVWGHIIQVNALMFEEGIHNCPGEVVYSLEDSLGTDPNTLERIAHKLFSLKGTEPEDPELEGIARYLTDEMIRVFGLAVPHCISPDIRCQISTVFFVRKHLPMRRVCASLLPLIVLPRHPFVAIPLPERYWPEELIDWWSQES